MTDAPASGQAPADPNQTLVAEAEPPIVVHVQYVKDLSFEAPTTPGVFGMLQKEQPNIGVSIDVRAEPMGDKLFEVVLHVKAECRVGQTSAFVVELAYGGLFSINVPNEYRQAILLVECPRLLFPFVRYIVSDATRDGGFPPLLLSPVDFAAMYRSQLERQAAAQGQPAASPAKPGDGGATA